MKILSLSISAAGIMSTLPLPAQERPNIIMFLVDDMGWQDTSVPFYSNQKSELNQRYHTPNMERLASMGVRFTSAYACAISSPSRCSLMSGMNAARHRVTNWTLEYDKKTDASSHVLDFPDWHVNGIQPDTVQSYHNTHWATPVTPLPQILRDNGYYTIHCGKAHFGSMTTAGANPLNMGFDINIAGGANGAPASYLGTENFGTGNMHVAGLEKYHGQNIFLTEALTREAIEALKVPIRSKQPFFLYMAHYAVHVPYSKDDRFFNRYYQKDDTALKDKLNYNEACYASLVEGMDKSLGDILNFIEKEGIENNTIILFMSDNGGEANGPRQGTWFTQNAPAHAGKGSSYEGGIHEPMIVYMPHVTQGGTTNETPIIIEDFFPTILDMASIKKYKTRQTIDGISFLPMLKNPNMKKEHPLYWHYPNLWGEVQDRAHGYGAYSAIMENGYKLIYFWETQEKRLFDIKKDIGEKNNLITQYPRKAIKMARKLSRHLKKCRAQRPKFKKTGSLIPYPDGSL